MVLGWWYWAAAQVDFFAYSEALPKCSKSHNCDGLPPWLRKPWWSHEATCPVTGDSYTECLAKMPWYLRANCNLSAGQCYLDSLPQWGLALSVFPLSWYFEGYCNRCNCNQWAGQCFLSYWFTMVAGRPLTFGPLVALLVSLLLSAALWRGAGAIGQQVRVGREKNSKDESDQVTLFKRVKFVALDLFPLVLDVFLDLNGNLQYVLTGNFQFALVSAGIFAMSTAQQLRRGVLHKFWQAASESMQRAHATDDLQVIMLSEKSTEAATQLMLQYYAFQFVTSSELAIWSFLFSMALSLKGVAEAAYYLVELDLYHKIAQKEYEQLT
eukprot:Skav220325  [mRNA]  locus=scaffold972:268049:269023:- [translate_table: standard]